ncbi:hypothetical protein FBZ83_12466 [Azospirillum brasilense]|uniref:Uncharacterized protein n=2 Tax=Azospirillum brasilense TaxID=192 RepID=A0A560BRD0_AZOBR|nr:hypothetical protein FBZ83_12466 [Azospirillum brasilense]
MLTLRKRMSYYRKHAPDVGLQAFHERVCTRFELVYAAAMLAIKFGVLPYSKHEALEAIQYAHRKGMFDALAATSTPRVSGVQLVKAFIEANKASFIDVRRAKKYDKNALTKPKGYKSKVRGSTYFLFLPGQFECDACTGLSYESVIAELRKEDVLKSYRGGNTVTRQIPGHTKKKHVICISARILKAIS